MKAGTGTAPSAAVFQMPLAVELAIDEAISASAVSVGSRRYRPRISGQNSRPRISAESR